MSNLDNGTVSAAIAMLSEVVGVTNSALGNLVKASYDLLERSNAADKRIAALESEVAAIRAAFNAHAGARPVGG